MGLALGFGVMAYRALDGTDYLWWSWWAIPGFWGAAALASLVAPYHPRVAGAIMLYVAVTGGFFFADVYGYAAGVLLAVAGLTALIPFRDRTHVEGSMEGDASNG